MPIQEEILNADSRLQLQHQGLSQHAVSGRKQHEIGGFAMRRGDGDELPGTLA